MKEKVSIIVPVYKVEQFLRKCVNSLINQTYKNIEIILVDDGSPDNCGKICDAFARMDKRIKVIHQKNGGLCAARNAGLNVATGDYIGFVDSDDWASLDMYEYLLTNIKKYEADISACRYYRVIPGLDTNVRSDGLTYVFNKDEAIEELITKFTIRSIFTNKLFKKELFNNTKFPEGHVFEGNYLMHKIFKKCNKIVFLPDAKYYYFDNADSIVNVGTIKNQSNFVISKIVRYNDIKDEYPKLKKTMLLDILVQMNVLIESCSKNKKQIKGNKNLLKQIGDFYKENYKDILSAKVTSKVTLFEFKFFNHPNIFRLFLANLIRISKKTLKFLLEIRELFIFKLKGKMKKPYKSGVTMEDLTIEDKEIFDNLHKNELKLLDEFVRICDKHNLTYYLYGGTLLGAVRHKGFIPWDDDIDIIMPREDYEKFGKVCKKELRDGFYYQTNKIDSRLPLLFAKLRLDNTYVEEEKYKGTSMHQGIFIDILPLDVFPEVSNFRKKYILGKFNALNSACQTGRPMTRNFYFFCLYLIYKLFPNKVLQNKRNKYIQKWSKCDSKYVCSFGSHYRPVSRRVMKKEWFENKGLKLEFEGKKYSVPGNYEGYLLHLFGPNYMSLPPEKDRVNHFNFYNVNFNTKNKGEDKNEKRKK